MLDKAEDRPFPLNHRDQKIFWVLQLLYDQQMKMFKNKTHSVDDRIVNIYQPYVRPIVRGKDNAQVEFGAKLGVSLQDGYARINTLSWDAYNENTELQEQVEKYKEVNGCYPEVVITDKIYGTRTNACGLKERNIRFSGKPLGRLQMKSKSIPEEKTENGERATKSNRRKVRTRKKCLRAE